MGASSEGFHLLRQWLDEHKDDPYPSSEEKEKLVKESQLTRLQVDAWFTNARQRYTKPKVRRGTNPNYQRYSEETRELLEEWLLENKNHPYPQPEDLVMLMEKTGLSKRQLQNWFTNARKRNLLERLQAGQSRKPSSLSSLNGKMSATREEMNGHSSTRSKSAVGKKRKRTKSYPTKSSSSNQKKVGLETDAKGGKMDSREKEKRDVRPADATSFSTALQGSKGNERPKPKVLKKRPNLRLNTELTDQDYNPPTLASPGVQKLVSPLSNPLRDSNLQAGAFFMSPSNAFISEVFKNANGSSPSRLSFPGGTEKRFDFSAFSTRSNGGVHAIFSNSSTPKESRKGITAAFGITSPNGLAAAGYFASSGSQPPTPLGGSGSGPGPGANCGVLRPHSDQKYAMPEVEVFQQHQHQAIDMEYLAKCYQAYNPRMFCYNGFSNLPVSPRAFSPSSVRGVPTLSPDAVPKLAQGIMSPTTRQACFDPFNTARSTPVNGSHNHSYFFNTSVESQQPKDEDRIERFCEVAKEDMDAAQRKFRRTDCKGN